MEIVAEFNPLFYIIDNFVNNELYTARSNEINLLVEKIVVKREIFYVMTNYLTKKS